MRISCLVLGLLFASGAAQADKIYRWIGPDNKVYYGDTPPAGARDLQPFGRKVGTGTASDTFARETPAAQPAEAQAADCARLRGQLSTYRNAARLVERDSLGREREYSEEERAQLIARTQSNLVTRCGDEETEVAEEAAQ